MSYPPGPAPPVRVTATFVASFDVTDWVSAQVPVERRCGGGVLQRLELRRDLVQAVTTRLLLRLAHLDARARLRARPP